MSETKVSVIILSYNTKELLRQCLKSLEQETSLQLPSAIADGGQGERVEEQELEIIVVDNKSTDGSVEILREWQGKRAGELKIKLIENSQNLGFAKGNNQAAKVAKGEYVFFLNSDTIIKDKALAILAKYLSLHTEVAAVSPLLLNEDGSVQKEPCYLKFPSPLFVFIYYNRILKFIANNLFPGLIYSTQNFSIPNEVVQLPGAALMIRKEVFKNAGGFEESFPHFFEDVDLSYRLRQAGRKLFLVPEAKIVHFGRRSLEPKVKKEGKESFYYLNFNSLFKFCEKHYQTWEVLSIKVIVFLIFLTKLKFNLIKKLFWQ